MHYYIYVINTDLWTLHAHHLCTVDPNTYLSALSSVVNVYGIFIPTPSPWFWNINATLGSSVPVSGSLHVRRDRQMCWYNSSNVARDSLYIYISSHLAVTAF